MDNNRVVTIENDEEHFVTDFSSFNRSSETQEMISLMEEIKNDSGLGVCDSMDVLREGVTNNSTDIFNCESNDSVIGKTEPLELHLNDIDKVPHLQMPKLIPLSQDEESTHHNISISSNTHNDDDNSQLPQLFPLPTALLDTSSTVNLTTTTKIKEQSDVAKNGNDSRRSSLSSSFIDSLLDKLRRNNSDSSGSDRSPQKILKSAAVNDEDLLVEIKKPIQIEKPSNPNMLPTPIVENQRIASAFVNSDEEYEKAIAKTKHKRTTIDMDRSRMSSKSQPPKMKPPILPTNLQQPRTLAEKRALVNKNVDFLMIEQESKIFKQIQRKKLGKDVNYNIIESIMCEDVPINYGPWKALSWLRTKEGNYIQQYINIDGHFLKLAGSRGNHFEKYLSPQSSKPFGRFKRTSLRSIRCCEGGKVQKRIIENLANAKSIRRFILEESLESYKKLEDKNLNSQLCSIKPRPLCKKIEFINQNRKLLHADEDSTFLGDYMKFWMPDIKLQVSVENKGGLHPMAKKYLNEIIPYQDLNENWINFSLSAIKSEEKEKNTFEFSVPYQNNKNHILVREILKSKEDSEQLRIYGFNDGDIEDEEDDMEWTFCKGADLNDELEVEVIDVIKDITNSVFINLNDDLFTKEDDLMRSSFIAPIKTKEAIEEVSSASKNEKSKKILLELRRLNANVVKAGQRVDDEEDIRRHATAHLAKGEKELRATVIVTDSDAVLLGNKEKESRRQKKLPKRYSDYLHDESEKEFEPQMPPAKKVKPPKELQDEPFKAKIQKDQNKASAHSSKQQSPDSALSHEDLKTVKKEINKWLHVNVEIRKLENLENVQPWCMFHNFYKCGCKEQINIRPNLLQKQKTIEIEKSSKSEQQMSSVASSRSQSVEADISRCTSEENNFSRDHSVEKEEHKIARRVLPVELRSTEDRIKAVSARIEAYDDSPESPKIEVLNICELVNGGIGPIFINVYDTKINRLNQIFRSILNNKTALAYVDGMSYFIDMRRIDVTSLKFDSMREELDHPVFIIQPKLNTIQAPTVSNYPNDFVKLLFDDSSKVLIEVKDKLMLKEIGDVIESVLQSVRRKIETKIDGEPNKLVKEQLSMITRDRSNSGSSGSSTYTSPLHFDGKELPKAPEPGRNTPLMRDFNKIFSIRMQRLCAIIKSNSLGLRCLEGHNNKFYIYRWDLLLKSFEEELIQIWQVKFVGESGKTYYMMILTDTIKAPKIEHAERIVNIKSLSFSNHMTELTRMILLKAENAKTRHMTILLYGCQGYFRVCGVMNSKENYFGGIVAKPTRATHPRLTAKIQKVYNIWYGLHKTREIKRLESNVEEPKPNQMRENDENVSSTKDEALPSTNNLEINTTQKSSYKWFLFNICNDFSDIYIKHWNRYLSYKVIVESIEKAKKKRKAIQLISSNDMEWPKIFALPAAQLKFKIHERETMSDDFLLFGPYLRSSSSYLMLMQNVDGKMYTRDYYEKLNGIKRPLRTRCLWIYANTLKCIRNVTTEQITLMKINQSGKEEDKEECDEIESIPDSDDDVQAVEETRDPKQQTLKISTVVGGFREAV